MSTSRDNLPVVEEKSPPPTVIGTLWEIANWVAKRELLMRLVMVAVLIALGAAGIVYAQDAGVKLLKPVELRQDKTDAEVAGVKAQVLEQNRKIANVERVVLTLDLNMRLMLESRGIKPIDLPAEQSDGGR